MSSFPYECQEGYIDVVISKLDCAKRCLTNTSLETDMPYILDEVPNWYVWIGFKHACTKGHLEIVKCILNFLRWEINHQNECFGVTPFNRYDDYLKDGLRCACEFSQCHVIDFLIYESRPDRMLEHENWYTVSPKSNAETWHQRILRAGLVGACKGGHLNLVKRMILLGAKDCSICAMEELLRSKCPDARIAKILICICGYTHWGTLVIKQKFMATCINWLHMNTSSKRWIKGDDARDVIGIMKINQKRTQYRLFNIADHFLSERYIGRFICQFVGVLHNETIT